MTTLSNVGANPYSKNELRPLVRCFMVSAAAASVCFFIAPTAVAKNILVSILPFIGRFVPSIATISSEMLDPKASEIILAVQWLFAPIYLFIWFCFYPPWSSRMRRTVAITSQTLTETKRTIGLVIGVLFFGSWLLGDFQFISFPTFYNGKYVYPLSEAVPQLKLIYVSRVALTIYAWVGPVAEASIIWMFFVLVLNAKIYVLPQRRDEVTK
jgi:hypothetical protein